MYVTDKIKNQIVIVSQHLALALNKWKL